MKRVQLPLIQRAFKLQEPFYQLSNGSIVNGEEILMIGSARFSSTRSIYRTMSIFQKDVSQLSRALAFLRLF